MVQVHEKYVLNYLGTLPKKKFKKIMSTEKKAYNWKILMYSKSTNVVLFTKAHLFFFHLFVS